MAFVTQPLYAKRITLLHAEKPVGIFFGTSTGNTEEAARLIAAEFGDVAAGPFDIDGVQGKLSDVFAKFDSLVVGTPTWNTGEGFAE